MANTVAQIDRLASAGYMSTQERDGCARCRFSEIDESCGGKVYYCTQQHAEVTAIGWCRDFARADTAQRELPFVQTIMREIADAVGHATAFQLVRRWGGRELRVPMTIDEHHPIALSLGLAAAQRLVKAFGGQRLELPVDANVMRQKRDLAIVSDRERGISEEQCAIAYGLTRQAVRAIYAKLRGQEEGAKA